MRLATIGTMTCHTFSIIFFGIRHHSFCTCLAATQYLGIKVTALAKKFHSCLILLQSSTISFNFIQHHISFILHMLSCEKVNNQNCDYFEINMFYYHFNLLPFHLIFFSIRQHLFCTCLSATNYLKIKVNALT